MTDPVETPDTDGEDYAVRLDVYAGPLDLLLFLIRKAEVEVSEVAVAQVADQYLRYLEVLSEIDINRAGDFLVLASTLMEMKSRALLPMEEGAEAEEDVLSTPGANLVQELLEYRRFKGAARHLASLEEHRLSSFPRPAREEPETEDAVLADEATVWDLLTRFQRVYVERPPEAAHHVVFDETPIEVRMEELLQALAPEGRIAFSALFEGLRDRGRLVGTFLAILELVRLRRIRAEQIGTFGEIYLIQRPPEDAPPDPGDPAPFREEEP